MKTIIKWPGGKERELVQILQSMPAFEGRYVEPFAGGAALFWALEDREQSCLNDRSEDLILLYRCVRDGDPAFLRMLHAECAFFSKVGEFADNRSEFLLQYYGGECGENFLTEKLLETLPASILTSFPAAGSEDFASLYHRCAQESLADRRKRTAAAEKRRGAISGTDRCANMEAALKAGFYNSLRELLNHFEALEDPERSAVFWFIREFCYSSMFRYNKKGEFNVPYGGISYNGKDVVRKAGRLASEEARDRLRRAQICCMDFEAFLDSLQLTAEDFVFVDPPYDSDFSEYAGNRFGREEQIRLCRYLERTPAKVMAVIKDTPFVYELYRPKFKISSFDKKYLVSFKNRNERSAQHLLITNY